MKEKHGGKVKFHTYPSSSVEIWKIKLTWLDLNGWLTLLRQAASDHFRCLRLFT